jgi:hypothetical protein
MEIIAIRDINQEEEVRPGPTRVEIRADCKILTSYIDVGMPVERRHSELQATYRFTCDCSLCSRDLKIRATEYQGSEIDQRASIWHRDCKRKFKGKASLPLAWQDQSESFSA